MYGSWPKPGACSDGEGYHVSADCGSITPEEQPAAVLLLAAAVAAAVTAGSRRAALGSTAHSGGYAPDRNVWEVAVRLYKTIFR